MSTPALSYEELKTPRAAEAQAQERLMATVRASGIPQRYQSARLGGFKATTREQNTALRAVSDYLAQFRERSGSCLVLAGRVGTGKTHLACAIGLALLTNGHDVCYATVSRTIRTIRRAYGDRALTEEATLQEFVAPDLLILDEIGKQRGTEDEQMLLFEVLNDRYNALKPTIVVSNHGKEGLIKYLGEPLFDRLRENGGVFVPFTWESHR